MSSAGDDVFEPTGPRRDDFDSNLIVELRALVTREAAQALDALAGKQGRTPNEALQNAIALAFYIDGETSEGGGVMVRRSDGKLYELIFPWAMNGFSVRSVRPRGPRFMRTFRRA